MLFCTLVCSCGRSSPGVDPSSDLQGPAPHPLDAQAELARPDVRRPPDSLWGPVEGLIYLLEVRDADSSAQQGYAFAFFGPRPLPFFARQKELGSGCAVYPTDEVGPLQYSAGPVTISGGPYTVLLETEKQKQPDDWLYPAMLFPDFFETSTKLVVEATGGQVHAFSGQATGVGDLMVSFPTGPVKRSGSLVLPFTKTTGTVWTVLWGVAAGNKLAGKVVCMGDAAGGKITVPAAALGALPSSAHSVMVRTGLVSDTLLKPSSRLTVHLMAANLVTRTYLLK